MLIIGKCNIWKNNSIMIYVVFHWFATRCLLSALVYCDLISSWSNCILEQCKLLKCAGR